VAAIAVQGIAGFNALTSTLAILMAVFFLLFGALRMGWVAASIVIAAELTLGVLEGIALGVVLSLLVLIYRTSHPHGAVLGQVPGTEAYRSIERHPEAITFPGLLIWRPGGELFFASIGHLGDGLKAVLVRTHPPPRRVLVDAEAVNFIDVSACDTLLNLIRELQGEGITFAFARMRDHLPGLYGKVWQPGPARPDTSGGLAVVGHPVPWCGLGLGGSDERAYRSYTCPCERNPVRRDERQPA
jgi:MFS superfamily sulfate permease-like transporter